MRTLEKIIFRFLRNFQILCKNNFRILISHQFFTLMIILIPKRVINCRNRWQMLFTIFLLNFSPLL